MYPSNSGSFGRTASSSADDDGPNAFGAGFGATGSMKWDVNGISGVAEERNILEELNLRKQYVHSTHTPGRMRSLIFLNINSY